MKNDIPNLKKLKTAEGVVHIISFLASDTIPDFTYDHSLINLALYSPYFTNQNQAIEESTTVTNIILAVTDDNHVIGYGILALPDEEERWYKLGSDLMTEVKAIEVCRDWRGHSIGREILATMIATGDVEKKVLYFLGYSWNWDLDQAKLNTQAYRQMLIRLFESFGFDEYETDDPTISIKFENVFMSRIGKEVSEDIFDQFTRVRFNIPPRPSLLSTYAGNIPLRSSNSRSLFTPLIDERYTGIRLFYNWKMDLVTLQVSREWDDSISWEKYNQQFTSEQYLSSTTQYLNDTASRELFKKHHLEDYLDEVIDHVKMSRHQGLECLYEPKRDIRLINYLHSSTLGQDQIYRALRTGGICFTNQSRDEIDMLAEGLNLSRAMSFKNASSRVPFGGCRISILSDSIYPTDRERIGFLAYAIDRTRACPGPDMGFQPELIDVMRREGYTLNITGGWDSKVGPPGPLTAYGVYLAVKEAAYAKFSSLNLAGRKIVVQGLGSVGLPLVEQYLMNERADIYVAEIDHEPVEHLLLKFPGQINVIRPEQVPTFDAEIWIPCATSGVIVEEEIKDLKYKIIIGAANNSLRALNQREEIRLSQLLGRRGILFQIDWLHNTAGIISGAEEYIYQNTASYQRVIDQVEHVCRDGVRKNLKEAASNDITPTEQAYRHFNKVVY